jgi:HK97 gp10 family phage protein
LGNYLSATNNMSKVKKDLENALHAAMLKSAIDLRNAVLVKLSGARTGRMYRVPATKRMYRASAAGEPPAVRLGHLRASYKYLVTGKGVNSEGVVGSDLDYSHYLEYGTAKIKPRPHLKPAFQESKNKIQKHFEGLL